MYFVITSMDWAAVSAIGSMIAAIIAAVYTVITYQLLQKTNQTSERTNRLNEFEIYHQISVLLNTDSSRKIFNLCTNNKLEIIRPDDKTANDNQISSTEINLVLNSLEDLVMFWKKGLITIGTINEGIGYKILKLGNCQAIVDHIENVRKMMPNVFSGFERLYAAVYDDSKPEEQNGHRPTLFPKMQNKTIKKQKTPIETD